MLWWLRLEQNLRKIVTKNYSLPAANIPPPITICAACHSNMIPEGLKPLCMIQVFPPSRFLVLARLTSHNLSREAALQQTSAPHSFIPSKRAREKSESITFLQLLTRMDVNLLNKAAVHPMMKLPKSLSSRVIELKNEGSNVENIGNQYFIEKMVCYITASRWTVWNDPDGRKRQWAEGDREHTHVSARRQSNRSCNFEIKKL